MNQHLTPRFMSEEMAKHLHNNLEHAFRMNQAYEALYKSDATIGIRMPQRFTLTEPVHLETPVVTLPAPAPSSSWPLGKLAVAAVALGLVASPRQISRRSLFTLGFRKATHDQT